MVSDAFNILILANEQTKEIHMQNKAKLSLLTSMIIFGTIGIFRRYIPLSSSLLAFYRAFIGTLFLVFILCIKKTKINTEAIQKNLCKLIISGGMIGINWILLFEAYNYTSIACATLCYYMAPMIVILLSPLVFKEKLTKHKILCTCIAFIGIILVSNIFESNLYLQDLKGIAFGLGAAILYGSVIILNKTIKNVGAYEKTIVQLSTSAFVLLPYIMVYDTFVFTYSTYTWILILIVGIVHTGIAYALYFSTSDVLSAHTMALYSYIDPIVAIVLSVVILNEAMSVIEIIGAICILSATILNDKYK